MSRARDLANLGDINASDLTTGTLGNTVQDNITRLGTVTTGTFNGTIGTSASGSANLPAVKTALNASGDPPIFACRAWVNFDGTSGSGPSFSNITVRGSGNIQSITDNGTGLYTINFSTAMPNTNYAVAGIGRDGTNAVVDISLRYNVVPATGSLAINTTQGGSFADLDYVNIIVIT